MEAKDTWLLLVGAILGFIGSLLATFTAPSLSNALGKLKSGFIERNRARALASFAEVHDLKFGKRDKYLYAINSWGFINVQVLFCIAAGLAGFFARRVVGPAASEEDALLLRLLSLAIAMLALFVALKRTGHLVLTLDRIANFEHYRAELLRRWPDIVLPDPE